MPLLFFVQQMVSLSGCIRWRRNMQRDLEGIGIRRKEKGIIEEKDKGKKIIEKNVIEEKGKAPKRGEEVGVIGKIYM